MRETTRCSQAAKSFVCPFTRGFLLRQVWERGIEIIWALAISAASFRLFHQHGAGNGLLGAVPRWVTYLGRCGEKGWPPAGRMAGSKKVQRVGRQKEHAILTGSPQGGSFLESTTHCTGSLFSARGSQRGTGESSISSVARDARTHTYGCFQFSSTSELATMGRIGRVGHGLGRFGIGAGAWEKGGEACIARSVQGLYLAFGARGRRLGLYSLCPVSVC